MPTNLLVLLSVAALGLAAGSSVQAQPALASSVTDWGNVSIFGPRVTRSGGARTEIAGQRTEWDHDFNGVFNSLVDGQLEQNVWTEASVVAGAPVFRSYHDLKGSAIPFHNGVGWTGFRTEATYADTWKITMAGLPVGAVLAPVFSFGVHSTLGHLFPAGSTVALPPDYYPYNPQWGNLPPGVPVVGPLPTAPNIDLLMSVDNFHWYDSKSVPGNTLGLVAMGGASFSSGVLTVQNDVPFAVQIDFTAGWRMEHSEIAALLGPSFQRFSTNRVFDASNTGALTGVAVYDAFGALQQGWSLTDSQGVEITPFALAVPEPAQLMLLVVGGIVVLSRARRNRPTQLQVG